MPLVICMKKLFSVFALLGALLSADAAALRPVPDRLVHGGTEAPGPATRRGPIVLTEVHAEPGPRADGRDVRFIELYNANPYPQRMGGWKLTGDLAYTFPAGYRMPGLSYLVIAVSPADVEAVYGLTGVLGATGGAKFSYSAEFVLSDEIGAELFNLKIKDSDPWPAGVAGSGHSLVLARPTRGQSEPSAWSRSVRPGGSPGAAEPDAPAAFRTLLINELVPHAPDASGALELINIGSAPVSLAGCRLVSQKLGAAYTFPADATLAAHALVAVDEATLGFAVSGNKDDILLRAPSDAADPNAVIDAVRLPAVPLGGAYGRAPDGSTALNHLLAPTPGARNAPRRPAPVVLNEIMYHPLSETKEHEYLELHNTTDAAVDLTGWVISGDVDYECSETIPPHGYLVIANKRSRFMDLYPDFDGLLGADGFAGSLPNGSGTVRLRRPAAVWDAPTASVVTNLVLQEEVVYRDGGAWGARADGGGSSLERVDPRADPRLAGSWAASDETRTCGWKTISYTGPLEYGRTDGHGTPSQVELGLQAAGECLVDDVQAMPASSGNYVSNPSFEVANSSWRFFGTHATSSIESVPDAPDGVKALHVRATGRLHTGGNGIRGNLVRNLPTQGVGTIGLRVRWLGGSPDLLMRVRGNWIEAFDDITTTHAFGTPGRANSRAAASAAPSIVEVTHDPPLPRLGAAVTVYARVDDPDGLASVKLLYHRDTFSVTSTVEMAACEGGWYAGLIPAGTGNSTYPLVGFRVVATDGAATPATSAYPDTTPARDCLVRYGEPVTTNTFGVYRFWLTKANRAAWEARHPDSNASIPVTFISGNDRVIYTAGVQYGGSPFHCRSFTQAIDNGFIDYKFDFPADDAFLDDDGLVLASDGNSGNDPTVAKEQFCYALARRLGLPNVYRRLVHCYANGKLQNARGIHEDSEKPNGAMIKHWFPTKTDGRLYKVDDWFEYTPDNFSDFSYDEPGATLEPFLTTDADGGTVYKLARYRWNWLPRAAGNFEVNDYSSLFNLVGAINDTGNPRYVKNMEEVLDLDGFIGIPALQQFVGNYDAYGKERGKNAYIYDGPKGWQILGWDFDTSFGADNTRDHAMTDSVDPQSSALKLIDPSYRAMLRQPALARRCWRKTLALVAACTTGSDELVEYQDRYNALLADGVPVSGLDGVLANIQKRRANVIGQINAVNAGAFTLTSPTKVATNVATLAGEAPFEVATIRCNGVDLDVTWTSVTTWTAAYAVTQQTQPLKLEGVREDGTVCALATATLTYTGAPLDALDNHLVISGLQCKPAAPRGGYVEIYNTSATTAFDLGGVYLAGDVSYAFPSGTVVKPGGCAVVAEDLAVFAALYGAGAQGLAGSYAGTLSTNGTLRLCRKARGLELADTTLDHLAWGGEGWPQPAAGEAFTLLDPFADNNLPDAWKVTAENNFAQPGRDLVPRDATWRYLTRAAPEGWQGEDFNDDAWDAGPGPLGHDTRIEGQPFTFGTDFALPANRLTYYFRTTFDYTPAASQTVSLPASDNLVHRWTFDGTAEDAVTGVRAELCGSSTPSYDTQRKGVRLAGGGKGTSWIDLGPNVLPNDGSPVTLEIWATQRKVQNWSRLFDFGNDTSDYIILAFTAGTDLNKDNLCVKKIAGDVQGQLGAYKLNTPYHTSVVFDPRPDGTWDVTFRRKDATTGATLGAYTLNSGTSGWSLQTQGQANCWLGHSQYDDNDASATYYEVRVWKAALSDAQLTQNAVLGADALPETIKARATGLSVRDELSATYLVDDCAAVYVNGVEVQRSARTPEGPLTDTTAALDFTPPELEGVFAESFSLDPSLLHAGRNTLAVEVHQVTASSSDLALGFVLAATNQVACILPPGRYQPSAPGELPPGEPEKPAIPMHGRDNVVLNEFMAQNALFTNPLSGAFDDWFELYNNGTNTVSLAGWIVTDTLKSAEPPVPNTKATKALVFPAGTRLAPGATLRIWTGADDATALPFDPANLQAPFGLAKSADAIYLFDAATNLVDTASYNTAQSDTASLGRWPNGTGAWTTFLQPTPGEPNHPVRFDTHQLGGLDAHTLRVGTRFQETPRLAATAAPATTFALVAETGSTVPAGLTVDARTGTLAWTPTADQAPGVYFLHLCSVVAGEATDALPIAFTVLPPATDVLVSAGLSAAELAATGRLTLSWSGRADATYAIEWCDDLNVADWQPFPGADRLDGHDGPMSLTLDLTPFKTPQAFFRIRETK